MSQQRQPNDTKERVLARGFDLVEAVAAQHGLDLKRDGPRHVKTRCPWREDNNPSLSILTHPDGSVPAGSYIDRATDEKGDALSFVARLWGLNPRVDFPEILNRACEALGMENPKPKKKNAAPAVERREITDADRSQFATTYGLTPATLRAANVKIDEAFIPAMSSKQPCVLYPAIAADGSPVQKFKTFYRYNKTGNAYTIAAWDAGKRESMGKGKGLFPAVELETEPDNQPLVYTGGEEKALAARQAGFRALSFTHGEKAPSPEIAKAITARKYSEIILAFDNDDAGHKAAEDAAPVFKAAGAESIRCIEWPDGAPEKYDLADVLRDQGEAGLAKLISSARPVVSLVAIQTNDRQRREVMSDARRLMRDANSNAKNPFMFRRSGAVVTLADVESAGSYGKQIEPMAEGHVYGFLARNADWIDVRETKQGPQIRPSSPPRDVVLDILALPDDDLPRLESISNVPIFGRSGQILKSPGYHPTDAVWVDCDWTENVPDVPAQPTRDDVTRAVDLFRDLFCDFPFDGPSGFAHALSAILTPYARRLIDGPTPGHLFTSPTPGSGKSLAASLCSIATTGRTSVARALPEREEEREKMLFSELLAGPSVLIFDNASNDRRLHSPALAGVMAAGAYSGRLLGQSKMFSLANLTTVYMTGNNPSMSMELARRFIVCRIDPAQDQPWLRDAEGFRHPNVMQYCMTNRHRLAWGALTLIQNWIASGKPKVTHKLGTFESWSEVVGGAIEAAGVDGFLGNLQQVYDEVDSESAPVREFVATLWDRHSNEMFKPSELVDFCRENDLLPDVMDAKNERARTTRIGRLLSSMRNRVFGDLTIRATSGRKGTHYFLEKEKSAERVPNVCRTSDPHVRQDNPRNANDLPNVPNVPNVMRGSFNGDVISTEKNQEQENSHTRVAPQKVRHVRHVRQNADSVDVTVPNVGDARSADVRHVRHGDTLGNTGQNDTDDEVLL